MQGYLTSCFVLQASHIVEPRGPATADKPVGSTARARGLSPVFSYHASIISTSLCLPDCFWCFFCIVAKQARPSQCCSLIVQLESAHVRYLRNRKADLEALFIGTPDFTRWHIQWNMQRPREAKRTQCSRHQQRDYRIPLKFQWFCCFGAPPSGVFACFFPCYKTDGRVARLMNNHDNKIIPCFAVGMGLWALTGLSLWATLITSSWFYMYPIPDSWFN